MLDENLPVFFLKQSTSGVKHHASIYLSHRGSEPEPVYSLQYLDPASTLQAHKNCYALALFDAYIPDILFGEVLVRPTWVQPTISAEELRRHGGIPPPPEPRVPAGFNLQLYNPDQQVPVHLREGKWGSSDSYDFSLPEKTFRAPSASTLDRGQSDPAGLEVTPRLNFVWKRESKFSKDLMCYMTGKSTDTETKRSRKDPDIAIALWRSMRELTLYESNLSRIDTEDPKGLEVSLLLSAIVIKDFYFTSTERAAELFNIGESNSTTQRPSDPRRSSAAPALPKRQQDNATHNIRPQAFAVPPPPPDPREQWQIEAETARLRVVAEAEARSVQRENREREMAAEAERKRLKKMVEQEKREARRRAEEVEKETERLRREYGLAGQSFAREARDEPHRRSFQGTLQSQRPHLGPNGLPYAGAPSSVMMSGGNPSASMLSLPNSSTPAKKKKSIFGLRAVSDEPDTSQRSKLAKKQSSMW